ncbi:hypothetical protein BH09GEM1_BH09GEM1_48320 [soil metagenome]
MDLAKQLLPGTIAHAVHHLFEHELDLAAFDARFKNDVTGATAYPPRMLFQVVLCAYAHGMVSSRAIARACEDHVTFIALCGATAPHVTTIAHCISTLGDDIAPVLAGVLAVCDQQGRIGREMFAIDGVKLPSTASKHRRGTRAALAQRATKLEAAAAAMLARHRAAEAAPVEPDLVAKAGQRIAKLEADAKDIRAWLVAHPTDRRGPSKSAQARKSNLTDNESAKMVRDGGAGVWQSAGEQAAGSLYTARPTQGGRAVEAIPHDPEHREAGPSRVRREGGLKRRGSGLPGSKSTSHGRRRARRYSNNQPSDTRATYSSTACRSDRRPGHAAVEVRARRGGRSRGPGDARHAE